MLELIHPLNEDNPFQPRVRERNWLIINLLFETGIRVGELLSLRCNAVVKELDIQFGMLHFLVVNQNVYLNEDPRSRPPEAKTTSRKLPISEKLAERIDQYIRNGRRFRGRAAQRAAAFLFLNSDKSPAPLSIGGLYKILSRIESVGNAVKPVFSKIQAHRFRYSMMEELMGVLNGGKDDEEKRKQVLRYMGGWSPTSDQYKLYAAKQIIFSAHLALLKVHEDLMVKYDKRVT
jgi:integrase